MKDVHRLRYAIQYLCSVDEDSMCIKRRHALICEYCNDWMIIALLYHIREGFRTLLKYQTSIINPVVKNIYILKVFWGIL